MSQFVVYLETIMNRPDEARPHTDGDAGTTVTGGKLGIHGVRQQNVQNHLKS